MLLYFCFRCIKNTNQFMASLASFISELASVTGTKVESLTAFIEANKTIEIPDDIISGIKGGILTMESAKNNPILKGHFTATSRAIIDEEVYATMKEYGIDEQAIAEAKQEEKTANKVRLLALKIKETQEKKINAKGGQEKVLQEQIESLKKELADVNDEASKQKDNLKAEVAKAQEDFFNQLRIYKEDEHFQSYQYANDKVSPKTHVKIAKSIAEDKMKELGLKTVFDKESGQVKLLTATDTIYYKDNKPVDYKSFTDGVLAESHLLKVSEPPKQDGGGNPPQIVLSSNGQGKLDNSRMTDALNKSLAEVNSVKTN